MNVSVVLFTSDLRLHDHPPLRAALDGGRGIVPLFVRDPVVDGAGFAVPNRLAFLADCLSDLDAGLRERGGRLVVRHGDVVGEVCRVAAEAGADEVHMSADVSGHARRREDRLRRALEADGVRLHVHDTVTVAVAPGAVVPAASDHFAVFTPYFRHWSRQPLREPLGAPRDGTGPGRCRIRAPAVPERPAGPLGRARRRRRDRGPRTAHRVAARRGGDVRGGA